MRLNQQARCGECGYDLMGLPRHGRCPECGSTFDLTTGRGVRTDAAAPLRHERGDPLMSRIKVGIFAGIALLSLAIGGVLALLSTQPQRPLAVAALIAAAFAFAAVATWYTGRDG